MHLADRSVLLIALLLVRASAGAADLRPRAEEIAAAFRAGTPGRLTSLLSEHSPSKPAAQRRLLGLIDDGAIFDASVGQLTTEGVHGFLRLELRNKSAAGVVLEQYDVRLELVDGHWRIASFTSTEADRVRQLLDASAEQRRAMLASTALTTVLARELLHRGGEQLAAGEMKEASEAFSLAADMGERLRDPAIRAAAARGLGEVRNAQGDVPEAMRLFATSLQAAETAGDGRNAAKTLLQMAVVHRLRGERAIAGERSNAALELFRHAHDRAGEALALNELAKGRSVVGDYGQARIQFQESLRIFEELNDPIGTSRVLSNLGIDSRLQGAYSKALDHLRKALELSLSAGDEEGVALALGNIGHILNTQANYVDALDAYQRALVLHERLGHRDRVAAVVGGIGDLYSRLGNYPQAVQHAQRSLEIAEQSGYKELTASALHNLGQLWWLQGDLQRALSYYEKSLAIDTALENREGMAVDLGEIGTAYGVLGRYDEAKKAFDKSFAIAQELDDRGAMTRALVKQAVLARASQDPKGSIDYVRRAIAIAEEIGLRRNLWEALTVLGRLHRELGDLPSARAETEKAISIIEELRRGMPGEEMTQQGFETMTVPYQEMVGILVDQGQVADAWAYAERAKGRVLLDLLQQGRPDLSSAMTSVERAREAELLSRISQSNLEFRERLAATDPNAADLEKISAKARDVRLEYEAFLTGLYAEHPQLRTERGVMSPIAVADLAALFADARVDALVEFVVTEDTTYVFTAARAASGTVDLRVDSVNISGYVVEEEVQQFRQLLADREPGYAARARSLYDRFLRPAERSLRGAKVVCIVPDASLWDLPFQALQPRTDRFLIDQHALFYAPSATVLREMTRKGKDRKAAASPRLLAFGNPLVPTSVVARLENIYREASLGPVPETEKEIRRIAALYGAPNSQLHVGKDAREEVVKENAPAFDILHFATHGIFDDQNAMYSRLLLSPPSSSAEDGFLEAREIAQLNLSADLAVLSACETGRGRIGAGEGVIGMSWAFFIAGCPSTVASQWKVSSASTTELMVELHRALRSSDTPSKAEALRRAALKIRGKPTYRHPFYWAPFVLVGNGG